jgi:hypothetical protein
LDTLCEFFTSSPLGAQEVADVLDEAADLHKTEYFLLVRDLFYLLAGKPIKWVPGNPVPTIFGALHQDNLSDTQKLQSGG